ncbi:MAG TPA: D-aminoacyl-tRNA deacylase [Accumulibacter sp.]|uniref:D-aminoacyl-tRNA deacylase n=1 Tax=Candidatus Accumulibacter cognatus TaxID=2954383 RepID=A0A080M1D5_9PROT|nr:MULTISPECIES: D-aminoacyl-tRNA deacylase [Candidatus Accumulibacter]KFB74921.1 MAG: D-tyrosyl-tRNA(Tyr) deacylase [Candidatus Accumulibacter cognatus]MBL8399470.1 D-tyrosyl-tRNA(Tyr) deacylase [Accumulibacter sp.]MBN8517685.1 D-tyrosyl-tRNA(Tyr) deacylase [Accumulibacter sp.]MBO3709540.1 D-tyrosyl-tRNA(Tyr) deacylase [Accumulibacter sp.]MCC2867442.1 D-tyrosyl-tRNA(Tyr) deacylase [Candidatus Accumulibacter phosphatis]
MRVVVQRVTAARVEVGGEVVGSIGPGLLILAAFEEVDANADLAWMSAKLARLRIFPDAAGVMNRNVIDAKGELLAVSQFTLFASTRKGNRPSWSRAARPELAQALFQNFVEQLESATGLRVQSGVFGADMRVHLINDGPVTISIDSRRPE